MRVFYRGATVSFTHTFYDSSGEITSPSSAHMVLAFPAEGFPFRAGYETTTVALTQDTTTLTYTGAWNSANASNKGTVFYNMIADDEIEAVLNGEFQLRGNPANMTITTTT